MSSAPKALVLLSGGIDSSTCAAIAAHEFGGENVTALSILYGQRHTIEMAAAATITRELHLRKNHIVRVGHDVFVNSNSPLLDPESILPDKDYADYEEGPVATYVPFRNGVMLSIAAALALQIGASFIYYGAHAEDGQRWAYPDTTPEFNGSMANAIFVGTHREVRLVTPLQWLSKREIVAKALDLGVPLELTYSCYHGSSVHCGECATCRARIQAFKQNGLVDSVEYAIDVEWESVYNLNK